MPAVQWGRSVAEVADPFVLPGLWNLTPMGFGIGVVALFFIGLATSWLYTRRQHLEIVGYLKDALEKVTTSRDSWRKAYDELSAQHTKVCDALGIIPEFFGEVDAIRDNPPKGGEGDATTRRARRAAQARTDRHG